MARVVIVYVSRGGTTERMAGFIAEGVRISGHEVELKKSTEIESERDLSGYEGYIFGCPTENLDIPPAFKAFLSIAEKADLAGKVGGAFSSRAHPSSGDGAAADRLFEVMETTFRMRMSNLGPFNLEGKAMDGAEGMHACQDYGKSIGAML
jgi:flavodoxin